MKQMNVDDWIDALNAVDPFCGDENRLMELAKAAPDDTSRDWLLLQIAKNQLFITCIRGKIADEPLQQLIHEWLVAFSKAHAAGDEDALKSLAANAPLPILKGIAAQALKNVRLKKAPTQNSCPGM